MSSEGVGRESERRAVAEELDAAESEEEQEELLLEGMDNYELTIEDYEYEIYELEEYL